MSNENSSASAFPSQWAHGLTKRELFAALAMQSLAGISGFVDDIAADAVKIADATLDALAKEPAK